MIALKIAILIVPFTASIALIRKRRCQYDMLDALALLGVSMFILRTFVMGFAQAQSEHRYALLCIPFVLVLAMYELARVTERPARGFSVDQQTGRVGAGSN